MPRPDEGLIHAWLDGELDAAEAARVEKLVAEDAEWGAAAAEARGLIAASSRILGALDVVAGDVIPGGGRAAPTSELPRTSVPRMAPRRLVPTWMRVAAGAVLVAGVGYLANRDGRVESGVMMVVADSPSVAAGAAASTLADVPAPAPPPPMVAKAPVRADASADARAMGAETSVRAAEPEATVAPAPTPAPATELSRVAEERAVTAESLATARLADTEARERRMRSANARLEQVVVTGVPSAPATVSAPAPASTRALAGAGAPPVAQKMAATADASAMAAPMASAAALGAAAPSAPTSIISGCWRVRTTGVSDTLLVTIPVLRQLGDTLVVRVTETGAEAKVQRARSTALGPTALTGTATTASGATVPFTADAMRCPRP
jgi:hypothetical protein